MCQPRNQETVNQEKEELEPWRDDSKKEIKNELKKNWALCWIMFVDIWCKHTWCSNRCGQTEENKHHIFSVNIVT